MKEAELLGHRTQRSLRGGPPTHTLESRVDVAQRTGKL